MTGPVARAEILEAALRQITDLLEHGPHRLPSPQEILDAQTPAGGWDALTLASWGVPWPPPRGWRTQLEARWRAQHTNLGAAEQRQGPVPQDHNAASSRNGQGWAGRRHTQT